MNLNLILFTLTILQMFYLKQAAFTAKILLQVMANDKPLAVLYFVLTALYGFFIQNLQVDVVLFAGLFLLTGIDTIYGALLARRRKDFNFRIMRDKTLLKLNGYVSFLLILSVFMALLYVITMWDKKPIASVYIFNIPVSTAFLFFCAIEFLSAKDNIVAYTGIRVPSKFVGQVENFTKTESLDDFTKP